MKKQPLVISYLRFSHPEQMKGDSQRRQLELSERWAKERGYAISESLSDLGISAYRGANSTSGALGSLLRLVELGRVPKGTVLLVEELDRISRQSPEESLHLFLGIVKAGVVVVTLNTGDVFEQGKIEIGRLMIAVVKFCTAHDESQKKGRRLAEAWRNKRAKALEKPLTSLIPSWLKMQGGKIVADPSRVKVVKRIFRLASEGHGATHIAGVLNKSSLPVLPRSGAYSRKYVLYTLKNRAVLGEYQPGQLHYEVRKTDEGERQFRRTVAAGEPVKGYFPQVIPENEFYAVQEGLRRRKTACGPTSKFVHLFTGLIFSARDGSSLVLTNKRKGSGRRYVPRSVLERQKDAVTVPLLPVAAFEQAFLWCFPSAQAFVPASGQNAKELHLEVDAVLEQTREAKKRRDDLQRAYLAGKVDVTSVLDLLGKSDAQVISLENRLAELRGKTAAQGSITDEGRVIELFAIFEQARTGTLTNALRLDIRNAIRQLVERIECRIESEGYNYICGCLVKMRVGRNFDFTFKAFHVDPRTKNKLGHWVAGKRGDTAYKVGILDGRQLVMLPSGKDGETAVHQLID